MWVYKKGRLEDGVFCRLELTAEWGREGVGKMRELGEESEMETEGLRKDPLPLTPV